MVTKRKPVIRIPKHKCIQTEYLARQNVILERSSNILFGSNGNPEDGLAFQFKEFMSDHKRVVDDINTIKENIGKAIESAGTAAHAVELFKAEEIAKDVTKDDIEKKQQIADELKARIKKELEDRELLIANLKTTKKRDHWQRVFWVIMAVIGILSIWLGVYFGFRNSKIPVQLEDTKEQIYNRIDQQQGISKKTRGGWVPYIDEYGLIDSAKLK